MDDVLHLLLLGLHLVGVVVLVLLQPGNLLVDDLLDLAGAGDGAGTVAGSGAGTGDCAGAGGRLEEGGGQVSTTKLVLGCREMVLNCQAKGVADG